MIDYEGSADVLLNRKSVERMIQKARLEGALGYITHLCNSIDQGKIKTLNDLSSAIREDAQSTVGSIALLLVGELKSAGAESGLMTDRTHGSQ